MSNQASQPGLLGKSIALIKRGILSFILKLGYRVSKENGEIGYKITKVGSKADSSQAEISRRLSIYERLYDKATLARKPFYNVGSGSFWHPCWTNIDYVSDWYGDKQKDIIHYDLMSLSPLPIESSTAKIIYTSHVIEHIKENAVQNFFNEAYRALEPGGVFRIVTGPDAETDFRALMNNDEDWFYWNRYYEKPGTYEHMFTAPATSVSLAERWMWNVATPLSKIDKSPSSVKLGEKEIREIINKYGFPDCLDYFCSLCNFDPQRPGNHISWWTHDKIFEYLKRAGFSTMYRSGCNQSASPIMRSSSVNPPALFDSTHPQMSIFVEAIKN